MRTEIKAALVLGLFGILGAVIWGINSGGKNHVDIPLDVTPDDLKPSGTTSFAADFEKVTGNKIESPITTPPLRDERSLTSRSPAENTTIAPTDRAAADAAATDDGRPEPSTTNDQRRTGLPPRVADDKTSDVSGDLASGNASAAPIESVVRPLSENERERGALAKKAVKPLGSPPADQPLEPQRGSDSRLRALKTSPQAGSTYTIQPGDTFISIARERYGHDKYWKAIQAANPGLDATRLQENQAIKLPSSADIAAWDRKSSAPVENHKSADAAKGTRPELYTVEPGDTLSSIARKLLDDESRWDEIYELNKDRLDSPDHVVDGAKLRIPKKKKKAG